MQKKVGKLTFPIFFAFLAISFVAKGQKNEVGLAIGGFNYSGEVSPYINPLFTRPGANLFYRLNFSPVVALRSMFSFGAIYANEHGSSRAVSQIRRAEFSNTVSEGALMLEYNFFNFRAKKDSRKYIDTRRLSPYFTAGVAIYNMSKDVGTEVSNAAIDLAIPFGVGLKYKLTEFLNLGVEFVARKTFSDQIDGISHGFINNKTTGIPSDTDWYYFTGFTLSYTFYTVDCPSHNK
ncbi:MAG: DUF6089 family protein [Cytophagaceae bacterium]